MQNKSSHKGKPPTVGTVVSRNVQALVQMKEEHDQSLTSEEKIVKKITKFTGSLTFLYAHVVLFLAWISAHFIPGLRLEFLQRISFSSFTGFASFEAIFLTVFILISENRSVVLSERRADLSLQVSLLSEHEITKLIEMVDEIRTHLKISPQKNSEIESFKKTLAPDFVLKKIDEAEKE